MNASDNAIYIFYLLVISITMSMIFSFGVVIIDEIKAASPIDISHNATIYNFLDNIRVYFDNIWNFLLSFLIFLTIFSSAVERQSIMTYTFNFVIGIVISVVLMYLTATMLSSITTMMLAQGMTMPEFPAWLSTNIQYIFLINILAGLCSFIFIAVLKQQPPGV